MPSYLKHLAVTVALGALLAWGLMDAVKPWREAQINALNHARPDSFVPLVAMHQVPQEPRELMRQRYYFKKMAVLFPDKAEAWAFRGLTEYYLNDKRQAASSFEKAIELSQGFLGFYYNLAALHYHNQEFSKALTVIHRAFAAQSANTSAFLVESPLYRALFQAAGFGQDDFIERLRQEYDELRLLQVLCYYHNRDFNSARQAVATALAQATHRQDILNYFAGLLALQEQDNKAALSFLQRSVSLNAHHKEVYASLKECLLRLGEQEAAENIGRLAGRAGGSVVDSLEAITPRIF